MRRVAMLAALATLLVPATALWGTTWDFAQDFSTTSGNPNGVWDYGWSDGVFHAYDQTGVGPEILNWYTAGSPDPHGNINKNVTASPYENWGMYWAPGQTSIMPNYYYPGGTRYDTVLRWTAPRDTTITLDATFTAQNTAAMLDRVAVSLNGKNLFYGKVNGSYDTSTGTYVGTAPTQSYMRSLSVKAGDVIAFAADTLDPQVVRQLGTSIQIQEKRSWDYTTDWSDTTNAGIWQRGFLTGAEGTFNAFSHYVAPESVGNGPIDRWDVGDPDSCGNAARNTSNSPYENWGMYWEAGQTTEMPGQNGAWNAVRWTAPKAGQYKVYARFTDQRTDGDDVGVAVRLGTTGTNMLWEEGLVGFIGRSTADFLDGSEGYDYEATYSKFITLAAGQNLDFIVKAGFNYNATGLTITIEQVPEPGTLALLATGLIGLLAYAWRKRK
jgi:hypothetical protein